MFDRKHPYVKGHATSAGFAGAIMLMYWYFTTPLFYEGEALKNAATNLFFGMLIGGGAALLLVAAVCSTGRLVAILADSIVSFACGAIMIFYAVVWSFDGLGFQNLLFLVLGFMLCRNGLACFDMYRRLIITAPDANAPTAKSTPSQVPPAPHPASKASSALPKDGEPPPPEGYLAALSKEKDD